MIGTRQELQNVRNRIKSINPVAEIMQSEYSKVARLQAGNRPTHAHPGLPQVELSHVLDIRAFNLEKVQKHDPGFLEFRPDRKHDADIGSISFVSVEPLKLAPFRACDSLRSLCTVCLQRL